MHVRWWWAWSGCAAKLAACRHRNNTVAERVGREMSRRVCGSSAVTQLIHSAHVLLMRNSQDHAECQLAPSDVIADVIADVICSLPRFTHTQHNTQVCFLIDRGNEDELKMMRHRHTCSGALTSRWRRSDVTGSDKPSVPL